MVVLQVCRNLKNRGIPHYSARYKYLRRNPAWPQSCLLRPHLSKPTARRQLRNRITRYLLDREMAPNLIFGTATFGMDPPSFQDAASVRDLLTTLQSLNIKRLDTAARYPPLYPGQSESLIGETAELSKGFEVDTKIYTDTAKDGSGDLSKENMEKSVTESLQRLKRDGGVNVLYAHRADPETPLEEQIQNFNEQIKQGHCKAVSSPSEL